MMDNLEPVFKFHTPVQTVGVKKADQRLYKFSKAAAATSYRLQGIQLTQQTLNTKLGTAWQVDDVSKHNRMAGEHAYSVLGPVKSDPRPDDSQHLDWAVHRREYARTSLILLVDLAFPHSRLEHVEQQFRSMFPYCELEVLYLDGCDEPQKLARADIILACRSNNWAEAVSDFNYTHAQITQEYALVVLKQHPLAHQPKVNKMQLTQYAYIDSGANLAEQTGFDWLKVPLEPIEQAQRKPVSDSAEHLQCVLEAMGSKTGFSYLPLSELQQKLDEGSVVMLDAGLQSRVKLAWSITTPTVITQYSQALVEVLTA